MEMATKLYNVKQQQQQQYESSLFLIKPKLELVARLFKVSPCFKYQNNVNLSMDWTKLPYHDVSGKSAEHGRSFGSNFASDLTETKKAERKSVSISRLKKPFMPSSWKWMRTSGEAKVFNYQPRIGETSSLKLNIPSQFLPYLVDESGESFKGVIEMDDQSYLEMGRRVTVPMKDSESSATVGTTFPSLEFKLSEARGGQTFKMDWQGFAQQRKLAAGAWDEDWGYSKQGQPTLGLASMYDKDLKLSWDTKFSWLWLLLGALGLFGIFKLIRK